MQLNRTHKTVGLMIQRKCDQVIFIPTCLVVQYLPVYLAMLSSSSGYLVNLSISTGMMSFSCSRRHRRFLSAAWGTARKKETDHVGNFPQELNLAQRLTDIGLNNCSLSFAFNFVSTSFSGFILFQTDMLVFPHWSPERTVVLTCMKRENLWSFFFLFLMSSSADGRLLQKVPTALFIFSSSSPPNWKVEIYLKKEY